MQRKKITKSYSVSAQISLEDVDTLVNEGIDLIVCNRPDSEDDGQLPFADVEARAAEKGILAVHIPFVGGKMHSDDVSLFKVTLINAKNVHAYCRSGNRSTKIWEKAQEEQVNLVFDVVVVGAGSAGISTAASLLKRRSSLKICLIDPAEKHFYQPGWTLVGGGVFDAKSTSRDMEKVIPTNTNMGLKKR